jgi:AsmA-like C-terminal region/Protein of unknown function
MKSGPGGMPKKSHEPTEASLVFDSEAAAWARGCLRAPFGSLLGARNGLSSLHRMNDPIAGALEKLTEGGRALLTLPARGRALIRRVPQPVQLELRKLSSRGAHVCREIFAGIMVVGLIAIVGGYGRLSRRPISLPSLVPAIEQAINGELSDLHVKIDDAILQRSPDGPGVLFRLRNIRLIDRDGLIVAQAPLAAIGMSGSALLSGRIAPGSVDFIGPRLLLFYTSNQGLALSFSSSANSEGEAPLRGSLGQEEAPSTPQATPPETVVAKRSETPAVLPAGRQLDVTRTIMDVFERARRGNTSYLTRFGVKDAVVVLDQNGTQTSWQVPDFSIDLEHKNQRSILLGQANIASSKGEWQLEVRTEQRTRRQSLSITALIENLVPAGIAANFPSVAALEAFDMPVSGETNVELSNSGQFLAGDAKLQLGPGQIAPPWDPLNAMQIDQGDLHVRYIEKTDVVEIAPSTLKWGKSKATVRGEFHPVRDGDGPPSSWDFKISADNSVLAAVEFGLPPIRVDEWTAEGNVAPAAGRVTLSHFVIRSGTASIDLAGSVNDAPGSPEVHLTGEVSPMSFDMLKQFWPKFLAGDARTWAGQRVSGGKVLGGKVNISLKPGELAQSRNGGSLPPGAVSVDLDLADMSIDYIDKLPPIITEGAKLRLAGTSFSVDIPKAKIVLPSGEELALHEGRFFIADLRQDVLQGEITFRANGATTDVFQLLDREPLGYMRAIGLKPERFGGTAEGGFALSMPIKTTLEFKDIKLRGVARLDQATASDVLGAINVEGGELDVNVTEQAVEAKGDILIKGVPAKLAWQRIFYAPEDRQPPIRVSALLDEAARDKLGMKVNHLVRGQLPVTLSALRDASGGEAISMQADLTNVQLIFANMGWTKPQGHSATLQFDVAPRADGGTDLNNLKILGEDIAINGWLSLDSGQHLKGFYFSDFSFDLITHVEISATVGDGNVLDIKARGPSYDGKQFFQSLFSAGQLAEDALAEPADPFSIDLSAQFGTVVGFFDTTVRDAQITLKKRNGRLVELDAKGQLNGQTPLGVKLETSNGARLIRAESRDAGSAFRLVGFYPRVEGGEASLQVNLDANEAGTKSGTLWAQNFVVLGDAVVTDILSDPQSSAALGERKQRTDRTRIAFDQLRAPFAVGKGQFLLKDAYMNGPMLGATMRGRVDFKAQTVDLGGTYVPLYGLNSALGAIPILGNIFVGRRGEGLVGITFAIQGQLSDPAVLVNPISVLTPGIFRQIFEFHGAAPPAPPSVSDSSDFGTIGR